MPKQENELIPIFTNPQHISTQMDRSLIEGLLSQFPMENKKYRLEVSDITPVRKVFTREDEKEAILKTKSLTYPLKGTVKLIDKATDKVVDVEKDFPLMDSFHITDKHTMIYSGNNYSVSNQLQLLPGAYTRSRDNGELETHVNTGSGRSFSITLDPQKELFYIQITNSSVLLLPILIHVFHINKAEAVRFIPSEVWDKNFETMRGREQVLISNVYSRIVSTSKQVKGLGLLEMASQIKESMEGSSLSTKTTQITLGKSFDKVTGEVLLRCLKNLVDVYKGDREEDNRDSLQFKKVQNLPDFVKRRFDKNHASVKAIKDKLVYNLERVNPSSPKIREAIPSKPFSKIFTSYIVKSPLSSTPSETNPIESLENVGKLTVLGQDEGGIGSERGVPMSARNIDPSSLGVIDPSRTPESSHAGIDQRFTITSRRDAGGEMYARVVNNSGKEMFLSVPEMMSHTIGLPHQGKQDKMVQAQVKGKLMSVDRGKVDYWIPSATDLYTVTTNLVPFINNNHPGRLTMAGKAIPQALSLVEREAPLVQTLTHKNESFVSVLGKMVSTKASADGVITKVTDSEVHMKTDDGQTVKIRLTKNLPFNMKGFLDDEKVHFSVGQRVKKGDPLADNNYTKNGELALGKNLSVAYLPYKGFNHEDGIVISQSAANSMGSHHAYKIDYQVNTDSVMKKELINRFYPGKLTPDQLKKLDDKGFAQVGAKLVHGDPVYAVLEKREPSPEDRILGKLHKTLVNPYRLHTEMWLHTEPGEVVDTHTEGKFVRILARSIKGLEVGDKLTGLHGNKGIVSYIVPDDKMIYNPKTGKRLDLIFNPASVTSRINLGQLSETVASKIAEKTGKPYYIKNFENKNTMQSLSKELAKHGESDTETLYDPSTGKTLGNVLSGKQYILKLYKTTDSNYSARNVAGYDNTRQPTKGGEEGSKSVGWMEFLGLAGSDARHNLREIGTTKSEENSEYWSKFLLGQPLPAPTTTFATNKFFNYLKGSGIKVSTNDGRISAKPMTNADILLQSNGKLDNPLMLNSRTLEPERGGLFDLAKAGGTKGNRFNHYTLAEPIVNPVFDKQVKTLLGLTTTEFDNVTSGKYAVKHVSDKNYEMIDTTTNLLIRKIRVGV